MLVFAGEAQSSQGAVVSKGPGVFRPRSSCAAGTWLGLVAIASYC